MANCKGRIQLEDNTHLFWGRKSDRTGWVKSSDFLGWLLVEEITSSGQLKAREGIPLGQQADRSVSNGVRSSPRLGWDRDRWGHTDIKTSLSFPRAWGSGLPKPHHSTPSHPRGYSGLCQWLCLVPPGEPDWFKTAREPPQWHKRPIGTVEGRSSQFWADLRVWK